MFKEAEGKEAWLLQRRGKFTASDDYKLLTLGDKNKMFSTGGFNYIEEKAIECCTDLWESPKLEHLKGFLWGSRYEQPAFDHYVRVTRNYDMRYFGTDQPIYLEHNKDSGGSPDGLLGEGEKIYLGLEIKCPENTKTHWDYCKFKTQWDIRKEVIKHYTQCQKLMMITGAPMWHWVSFDDRYTDSSKKMKLIEILPDPKFQEDLEIKVLQAIEERNEMIDKFLNG